MMLNMVMLLCKIAWLNGLICVKPSSDDARSRRTCSSDNSFGSDGAATAASTSSEHVRLNLADPFDAYLSLRRSIKLGLCFLHMHCGIFAGLISASTLQC